MSIAKCFSALGFLELPRTEQEVTDAYLARVEEINARASRTETDELRKRLLTENYHLCLGLMRGT